MKEFSSLTVLFNATLAFYAAFSYIMDVSQSKEVAFSDMDSVDRSVVDLGCVWWISMAQFVVSMSFWNI